MEQLAAIAADVSAGEAKVCAQRARAQVIDFHVAGHGEQVERAVEFAHGFIHERGDDAAVDVARGAFMHSLKIGDGMGGDVGWVFRVDGEFEVQTFGVRWAAAETMAGTFIDCLGDGRGEVRGGVGF